MKRNDPQGPLTEKNYQDLCKLETDCTATAEYLQRCEACGINVDPEKRKNAEQLETARKLKAAFFPGRK